MLLLVHNHGSDLVYSQRDKEYWYLTLKSGIEIINIIQDHEPLTYLFIIQAVPDQFLYIYTVIFHTRKCPHLSNFPVLVGNFLISL